MSVDAADEGRMGGEGGAEERRAKARGGSEGEGRAQRRPRFYALRTRPVSWTSPPADEPEIRDSRIEETSEAAGAPGRDAGESRQSQQTAQALETAGGRWSSRTKEQGRGALTRLGGSVRPEGGRGDRGETGADLHGWRKAAARRRTGREGGGREERDQQRSASGPSSLARPPSPAASPSARRRRPRPAGRAATLAWLARAGRRVGPVCACWRGRTEEIACIARMGKEGGDGREGALVVFSFPAQRPREPFPSSARAVAPAAAPALRPPSALLWHDTSWPAWYRARWETGPPACAGLGTPDSDAGLRRDGGGDELGGPSPSRHTRCAHAATSLLKRASAASRHGLEGDGEIVHPDLLPAFVLLPATTKLRRKNSATPDLRLAFRQRESIRALRPVPFIHMHGSSACLSARRIRDHELRCDTRSAWFLLSAEEERMTVFSSSLPQPFNDRLPLSPSLVRSAC